MFFYATDSYAVYPKFIDEADQIASKSYMTRVEGENTKFLALLSTIAYKNSLLLYVSLDVGNVNSISHLFLEA